MIEDIIVYSENHWILLRKKRSLAIKLMKALIPLGKPVIIHGSVARGDVKEDSDIDVVILEPVIPGLVEFYLEQAGYHIYQKEIVQATPNYIPKVYIYLDLEEEQVVSYPLAQLRPREREFYKWGGELDLKSLIENKRVPGVNKDLILIIPTEKGHKTMQVVGNEEIVARTLGISIATIRERVEVLTRRREHGRTGVFLKETLSPDEPVEEAVKRIARKNPHFRRALRNVL